MTDQTPDITAAIERLRKLDEKADVAAAIVDGLRAEASLIVTLRNALSEIVAVVERAREIVRMYNAGYIGIVKHPMLNSNRPHPIEETESALARLATKLMEGE